MRETRERSWLRGEGEAKGKGRGREAPAGREELESATMDREGEEQEVGSGELTRKRIKARRRSRTPLKHTKKPAPRTSTPSQIFQASFPKHTH